MKLFISVLFGLFLFVLYVRFMESTAIFYPAKGITTTPKDAGLPYEDIYFSSSDGVYLNGWFLKQPPVSFEKVPTLVFFHGNAGNMSGRLEKLAMLYHMGLNVFIFDYRGYGNSQGHPTEKGMYRDSLAAYDLILNKGIDSKKIILYGVSLGGVAAVDVASHREGACLILDSTFSSAADMAKRMLPFVPAGLLSVKLDSFNKIKQVFCPKLFIHSPQDEVVPYPFGRKLYENAEGEKKFVDIEGGHNDGFLISQELYFNRVKEFLEEHNILTVE